VQVGLPFRLGVELVVFASATLSLWAAGTPRLALAMAVSVAVHHAWRVAETARPTL
jgi:alkanesulfonate monooxygenase SsuD/methylene tetrahydromethanopterin reductase-like flavin-dependent oxidoreductase (luciferase family)